MKQHRYCSIELIERLLERKRQPQYEAIRGAFYTTGSVYLVIE
ncbi:MAG: hypothetical protein ACE5OP_07935 [Candidatus Glassbacteria bacterium]